MAFRCVGSPMDEMKFLERMRAHDPESAANVVANGKLLVEYAQQGRLKAIQCALDHMQEVWRHLYVMYPACANMCVVRARCIVEVAHRFVGLRQRHTHIRTTS